MESKKIFNYDNNLDAGIKILDMVNNSDSKIRVDYLEKEKEFFRKYIRDKEVFVAGSGLGHDAFALAEYNLQVCGVDIHKEFVQESKKRAKEEDIRNVAFCIGDFTNLSFVDSAFNCSVFNMCTVGNFEFSYTILKELKRCSEEVYFDHYIQSDETLEKMLKMYSQEGWINPKIDVNKDVSKIVSEDGLDSRALSRKQIPEFAEKIGCNIKEYPLVKDFINMVKFF